MKRNYPPDPNSKEAVEDLLEIHNRIEQLFARSDDSPLLDQSVKTDSAQDDDDSRALRNISINSVGFLNISRKQIELKSYRGLDRYLICHDEEAGYHYMKPLEALYSLEMNKLLIYHNSVPLSLAEAYELLLTSDDRLINSGQSFREYLVFKHLNRIGYICLSTCEAEISNESRIYKVYERENTRISDRKKLLNKEPKFKLIVKDANKNDCFCDNEHDKYDIRTIVALVDLDSNISFVEFNQMSDIDLNLKSKSLDT